jgi:hypothetical protein
MIKSFNKKRLSVAFALVLMLAMSISCLPSAFGVTFLPNARLTYSYAAASPTPTYLGTTVFFVGWVYPPPSTSGALYPSYTFTLTKPDGTKITKVNPSSVEATSGFNYVVDQLGKWTLHMSFPGDTVKLDRLPSESNDYVVNVLNGTFTFPDYTVLPDYPWEYPISSVNQEWFRITGAWPKDSYNGYSNFNPYSSGPTTSHIIWRLGGLYQEGLLGGMLGHASLVRQNMGSRSSQPVAAMNMIYYSYNGPAYPESITSQYSAGYSASNATFTDTTSQARHVRCLDMNTGEVLWDTILPYVNYTTGRIVSAARTGGTTLQYVATTTGKGVDAQDYGQAPAGGGEYGSFSLWLSGGGLWQLDPSTGEVMWYQLEPGLSPTYDPFTGYWFINNYPVTGNFSCIRAEQDRGSGFPPGNLFGTVTAQGTSENGVLVWMKNVSQTGITMNAVLEGYIVQLQTNSTTQDRKINTWSAFTGDLIANGTYSGGGLTSYASSGSNPVYGDGLYSLLCSDGITRAWSFKTGSFAWASDQMDMPWGTFGTYDGTAGNGLVMSGSYAPYMYAYNSTTGKLAWKISTTTLPDGTQDPYNYEYAENGAPTWGVRTIATNAVYWASGEHTPGTPQQQGDALYCNALDGKIIWRLPYFKSNRNFEWQGVACEKLWAQNQYDGMVYMFGKGPTKTTLETSLIPVVAGGSTIIQGRITDESAGTGTSSMTARFPNGVPVVADISMDTWMAYLYTIGTTGPGVDLSTVKGVEVTLKAVGSDGSVINIGTVKANANGFYTMMWSPPGKDTVYTIRASFGGSDAYYPSYSDASIGVTAAPVSPIVTPTPTPTPTVTASPIVTPTVAPTPTPTTPAGPGGLPASAMYAIAAAIVVIVIVAVAALALRRRK